MSEPWKRLSWDEWNALSDEDLGAYLCATRVEEGRLGALAEELSDQHYDVEEHAENMTSTYYRRRSERAAKERNWKLQLSFPMRRVYGN